MDSKSWQAGRLPVLSSCWLNIPPHCQDSPNSRLWCSHRWRKSNRPPSRHSTDRTSIWLWRNQTPVLTSRRKTHPRLWCGLPSCPLWPWHQIYCCNFNISQIDNNVDEITLNITHCYSNDNFIYTLSSLPIYYNNKNVKKILLKYKIYCSD